MSVQVVRHTSRSNIYELISPIGSVLESTFTACDNGEIYDDTIKTNISAYLINGVTVTLPFVIEKDVKYTVTITKVDNNAESTLFLKSRKVVDFKNTVNYPVLLSESVQGTITVLFHPSDNKITVLNSSLLVDSNWSVDHWIVDPSTVVDLPIITGFSWKNGFWDYINNRIIIGATNSTVTSTNGFKLCAYHFTGDKAGQVWNLAGSTQNSYNSINSDTWTNTMFYFIVDQINGAVQMAGFRQYNSFIPSLLSWGYDLTGSSQFIRGNGTNEIAKKTTIDFDTNGKICGPICFQNIFGHAGYGMNYGYVGNNCFRTLSESALFDNITKNVYRAYDNIDDIKVINNSKIIASIRGISYTPKLYISASVKRRGVLGGFGAYQTQHKQISLYDFTSVSRVRSEVIVTETNATTINDGDYLNSIDKFIFVSNGTAGTSDGKRTIYLTSADYDGVNPILKQRFYVQYDVSALITNRLRY